MNMLVLGQRWGKDGSAWGDFGAAKGGTAGTFERGTKGHDYGDRDHAGFAYGSKGGADGFSEFAKHAADGHIADALEAGEHALAGKPALAIIHLCEEILFQRCFVSSTILDWF